MKYPSMQTVRDESPSAPCRPEEPVHIKGYLRHYADGKVPRPRRRA